MTNHNSKYVVYLILILLLNSGFCYAQSTIYLSNIDVIIYNKDDTDIRLFEKINNNQYIEVFLAFVDDDDEDIFIETNIEYDTDGPVTLKDLKLSDNDVLLKVKDIKPTRISQFLNRGFEIEENSFFKYGKDTNKLVLKFLNNTLSSIQEVYYEQKQHNYGLGSVRIYRKTDSDVRWRVDNASYFPTVDLDFGNDRHIYLLPDGDKVDFLVLPLTGHNYIISDDDGISTLKETDQYKMSYQENFSHFSSGELLTIFKNNKGKYTLVNTFKKDLLKSDYDTISYNRFFIIAKNKDLIEIFNSNYKKINIDHVKSAYLYRSGLEILDDKGAHYYNSELKIIDDFPPKSYSLCGTVNGVFFELDHYKTLKAYTLTKTYGGFASSLDERREYFLEKFRARDKISFLNNEEKFFWDENDDYVGDHYVYPQFLKITRGRKSGILKYNYTDYSRPVDTISMGYKKSVYYFPQEIEGELVLPINNDSIVFNDKDGLTYFYRKNKVGIFPRHKTVQYQMIRQKTNSFYAIIRDHKKGWLDIQTNIEYFDD